MAVFANTKLSEEFTALTARLLLCSNRGEIVNLSSAFGQAIEKLIEAENGAADTIEARRTLTVKMKFTADECANMDKDFRRQFKSSGQVANVIKRPSGRNTYVYEIRYRRGGYKIEVSSTDIKEARRRFLAETQKDRIGEHTTANQRGGRNSFQAITEEWLAYKKGKINDRTYKNYESYYRRYFLPTLADIPITKIRTIDIDKLLNADKARLYEDLRTVINSIFKYAIASGIITHNPVTLIPFKKADRTSERRPLTKEEQRHLLERLSTPPNFRHINKPFS